MLRLTEAHLREIRRWVNSFRSYLQSEEGQKHYQLRRTRCREYSNQLSADRIDDLTEIDFEKLVGDLWACEMWFDKSKFFKRLLGLNPSFDHIKDNLKELLWGSKPLPKRFDEFRERVKGLGPAATTELLTYAHPEECCIWNKRARFGLEKLKMDDIIPTKRYDVDGSTYAKVNEILKVVRDELRSQGVKDIRDLLDVDQFLEHIYTATLFPPVEEDYKFDHNEVRDAIRDLGDSLGIEAETEVTIATGRRIDALWRIKVGNLDLIEYAFEVIGGNESIDRAILNLQQVKGVKPSIQKVVVVSNTRIIDKMKEMVKHLPEEFKRSLVLMKANDILNACEFSTKLKKILDKLKPVRLLA